jgi:hypothetical protein
MAPKYPGVLITSVGKGVYISKFCTLQFGPNLTCSSHQALQVISGCNAEPPDEVFGGILEISVVATSFWNILFWSAEVGIGRDGSRSFKVA